MSDCDSMRDCDFVLGYPHMHNDMCGRIDAVVKRAGLVTPIPMLLWCPARSCGARHVDTGEFASKVHHTHACQFCGMVWRPAILPTVGVLYLPGFKNETD